MQFKVVSALLFATLAAAGTLPNTNPTNPANDHTNTDPAKTSTNTNPGNTNPGNTNPSNTNQGTNNINAPFPGTNGGAPPTINASKCDSGHLRCCKFQDLYTTTIKTNYYSRQELWFTHCIRCDTPSPLGCHCGPNFWICRS